MAASRFIFIPPWNEAYVDIDAFPVKGEGWNDALIGPRVSESFRSEQMKTASGTGYFKLAAQSRHSTFPVIVEVTNDMAFIDRRALTP
jgi:hypothetical protein